MWRHEWTLRVRDVGENEVKTWQMSQISPFFVELIKAKKCLFFILCLSRLQWHDQIVFATFSVTIDSPRSQVQHAHNTRKYVRKWTGRLCTSFLGNLEMLQLVKQRRKYEKNIARSYPLSLSWLSNYCYW